MVSAIGSSTSYSTASATMASTAALEAQIARDKKELSNCVNCESAKTNQGQSDIQALSNKIKIAEARLEAIKSAGAGPQSSALNTALPSSATEASKSAMANHESKEGMTDSASLNSYDSSMRRFVDIFA